MSVLKYGSEIHTITQIESSRELLTILRCMRFITTESPSLSWKRQFRTAYQAASTVRLSAKQGHFARIITIRVYVYEPASAVCFRVNSLISADVCHMH